MKTVVFLSTIVAFLATGCAAVPQIPKEVKVPVPVPCIQEIPPSPKVSTDAELKAMPDGDFVLTLAKDRLIWRAYSQELVAVLMACAGS